MIQPFAFFQSRLIKNIFNHDRPVKCTRLCNLMRKVVEVPHSHSWQKNKWRAMSKLNGAWRNIRDGGLEDDRAFILWEVNCLVHYKETQNWCSWLTRFLVVLYVPLSVLGNCRKNNHITMCKQAWLNIGYTVVEDGGCFKPLCAANQSNKTLPDCLNWNATNMITTLFKCCNVGGRDARSIHLTLIQRCFKCVRAFFDGNGVLNLRCCSGVLHDPHKHL